jgi:hypothetical protein
LLAHGFRSISLPSRGAFHLSLTVLVHYRSSRVFSLTLWSGQIPTEFHVFRGTQEQGLELTSFVYRTITVCGGSFQRPSARVGFVTPRCVLNRTRPVLLPRVSIGSRAVRLIRFRLFPVRSPLLREYYIFLEVLRCFTSPACLRLAYVLSQGYSGFTGVSCLIRESPVKAC